MAWLREIEPTVGWRPKCARRILALPCAITSLILRREDFNPLWIGGASQFLVSAWPRCAGSPTASRRGAPKTRAPVPKIEMGPGLGSRPEKVSAWRRADRPSTRRSLAGRLSKPPDDPRFVQVIGGHLHLDAIADRDADPALAHFSGDSGKHHVFVVQFDPKHRAGEDGLDAAFYFNMFFVHRQVA